MLVFVCIVLIINYENNQALAACFFKLDCLLSIQKPVLRDLRKCAVDGCYLKNPLCVYRLHLHSCPLKQSSVKDTIWLL
jgi:hypothetical protein